MGDFESFPERRPAAFLNNEDSGVDFPRQPGVTLSCNGGTDWHSDKFLCRITMNEDRHAANRSFGKVGIRRTVFEI